MILDRDLVKQAWTRSSGLCECKRIGCQHTGGRCNTPLEEKAFREDEGSGWYVRPINEFGPAKLFNVEAVCSECHNKLKPSTTEKPKPISTDRSKAISL